MLTAKDLEHLEIRGIEPERVHDQIRRFRTGFPWMRIERPCAPGDGIRTISETDHAFYLDRCERAATAGRLMKFVPASGVGSRMFRRLFKVADRFTPITREKLEQAAAEGDADASYGLSFFLQIARYPFGHGTTPQEEYLKKAVNKGDYNSILTILLGETGLNYPSLPKGLLPFHRYRDGSRTPFEEHLVEALDYVSDGRGVARAHFTVSEEHRNRIRDYLACVQSRYETGGHRLDITLSAQKPSTDTIAVEPDNTPFRDREGNLLFRAGGHGALLENLNDVTGDIVFIKNIDNVAPDHLKPPIHRWKRLLCGLLVDIQERIYVYLGQMTAGQGNTPEILSFCRETLGVLPPDAVASGSESFLRRYLITRLDRPLRVCGMVKNTGEPGGGPFWVRSPDGLRSLQIMESAQINPADMEQMALFRSATYFNPVDLVCGVRDRYGRAYDLRRFSDPEAGFIALKSHEGRPLKAMEHPGLWNGSMAGWNTVFVETPAYTFQPVKTIDDLLRPEHQPVE
jgi:hypothetical protein